MMETRKTISLWMMLLSVLLFTGAYAQADLAERIQSGKMIFRTNCAHCHGVHKEILGPMLGSITKKKDKAWLIKFIKDSQRVIASGDQYANVLAEKYHHAVMPCFNQFSDSTIADLLIYLEQESIHPTEKIVSDAGNYEIYLQPNILRGRQLFQDQCAACHSITKEGYGPALGSVTKRHDDAWIISFIHNSQHVINAGDLYATNLFKRFDNRIMVSMEFMKADDIHDILHYIEYASSSPSFIAGSNGLKLPPAMRAGVEQPVAPGNASEAKSFFKILFIIVGSIGTMLLGLVIIRFYRFLAEGLQD